MPDWGNTTRPHLASDSITAVAQAIQSTTAPGALPETTLPFGGGNVDLSRLDQGNALCSITELLRR
jgi:hypothetical protein